MNKGIVSDVFETLGGMVKGTAKQAVSDAKKMGEQAAVELGLSQAKAKQDDQQKKPAQTEEQEKKIAQAAKMRTAAKYKQILEEIKQFQKKREQEIPKAVSGKPGFDEGKAIKQLETGKPEDDKKKLPPLPVQRATKKTEMFRGASG